MMPPVFRHLYPVIYSDHAEVTRLPHRNLARNRIIIVIFPVIDALPGGLITSMVHP